VIGAEHGFGPGWCAQELAELEGFARDGLVVLDGPRVTLTETGRGLSRVVAAVFDAYLANSEARHSVAV
jgi:oxygen-independent coproporphyrinogen-3 oxidase